MSSEGLADLTGILEVDPSVESTSTLSGRGRTVLPARMGRRGSERGPHADRAGGHSPASHRRRRRVDPSGVVPWAQGHLGDPRVPPGGDSASIPNGSTMSTTPIGSDSSSPRTTKPSSGATSGATTRSPEGIQAAELAADPGVPHQALSERLRRATESLIENALVVDEEDGPRWPLPDGAHPPTVTGGHRIGPSLGGNTKRFAALATSFRLAHAKQHPFDPASGTNRHNGPTQEDRTGVRAADG